jgi:tetratricopeptide (TPR) repeat protein
LLIDFDKPTEADDQQNLLLRIGSPEVSRETASDDPGLSTLEQLQQAALEWEDQGELQQAAEAYRTLLVAGGPSAEVNFALADLLYRMGDLSAARERFYAAVELDEEYVEARANLGCVLAENNELELAVAAFQGALAFHPDYADVHYHLANSLDRLAQHAEAELHWRVFLALAPESPWADMARNRLIQDETRSPSASTPAQ